MRPFPRGFSILMVLFVLSVSFYGVTQDQTSTEPGPLTADEGRGVRVDAHLQRDGLAPGLRLPRVGIVRKGQKCLIFE